MFEIFHTLLIQWDDWLLWIWGICQWRSDLAGTTEGHWAGTQTLNVLPLQSRGSNFLYSTLTLWADQWGPFPPQTQTGTFLLFTLYSVCTVTKPEGHWGNRAPNKSCQITLSRASKLKTLVRCCREGRLNSIIRTNMNLTWANDLDDKDGGEEIGGLVLTAITNTELICCWMSI